MILFYIASLILAAALSGWLMTKDGYSYKLGEALAGLIFLGYMHFLFVYHEYGFWLMAVPAILSTLAYFGCRLSVNRDDWALQRRRQPIPKGPVDHPYTLPGYTSKDGNDATFI